VPYMDEGTVQSLKVVFTDHFSLGWCSNFVGSEPVPGVLNKFGR
jgi:hypothetical protein